MIREDLLTSVNWFKSLTIKERLAADRPVAAPAAESPGFLLSRWQQQPPFDKPGYFEQRLHSAGISREEFISLLNESPEQLSERIAERIGGDFWWLDQLRDAFAYIPVSPFPLHHPDVPSIGFVGLVSPVIRQTVQQLRMQLHALADQYAPLPFVPDAIIGIMTLQLFDRLIYLLNSTLVLELNVARVEGHLEGTTPDERFRSFMQRLQDRQIGWKLLEEYPVLSRLLVQTIKDWHTNTLELLERVCADIESLKNTFGTTGQLGMLRNIKTSTGDKHRGGKSVAILEFDSGINIVYKPRSLSIDVHFQQLTNLLCRKDASLDFYNFRLIDRDRYGWMEFITPQSCSTEEEVKRFYERSGAYLAVLYVLEATDFHFENLIAHGQYPVLIDLESFFHPDISGHQTAADQVLFNSVFKTGLLPRRIYLDKNTQGFDISGMVEVEGQLSPRKQVVIENEGSDTMQVKKVALPMDGAHNLPRLNGRPVELYTYLPELVSGFEKVYDLFVQHRAEFKDSLSAFADDEVRVLFRPTMAYRHLLDESLHPDHLRDGLYRELHFDWLWLATTNQPLLKTLIAAERESLERGDVPMFTTKPGSRHLWYTQDEYLENFFTETGLSLVNRKIDRLDQQDKTVQTWFIRAALETMSRNSKRTPVNYKLEPVEVPATAEALTAAARRVGELLYHSAIVSGDTANWIGLATVSDGIYEVAPLNVDLYTGLPGQVLFFAQLGHILREERYTKLAQQSLNAMRQLVADQQKTVKEIGAFTGWGGIIYTFAHTGALWHDAGLIGEAETLAELAAALIKEDEGYDIIRGAAGCIMALESVYSLTQSPRIAYIIRQCGEYLLATSRKMEQGTGWKIVSKQPLTGFSHGAAGIAVALLKAASITGNEKFRQYAVEAIDYERSKFVPAAGNWADLRDQVLEENNHTTVCASAWCNGAPGIGLGRLMAERYLDDPHLEHEINTALQTTLKIGFGTGHSLCHGDLGNIELLLQSALTRKDKELEKKAYLLAASVLQSIEKDGYICGIGDGISTPGLMLGLTGIGYGLLRLAYPQQVPSVLTLEVPR